ncbi:zonular occludens toxin domain-containing protein [Nitrosomonas oligotropha]|uniref:Zona occludens toxin, predicted ATPase n=1 Tax=Nitrosomonas oligotropha TaxID=42354 RepID=A0A1H8U657_9PROT|nr:zonular occludens toxin domain-containing protein [Nitrosomonas oligotropha]SDX42062.1 Zona occludens toxin, predicted ATPase [Nitrosomonas oligotropha]SEO98752.1 Zona occludens toxin, predicted ATPase [Nitrosomonas oligotropha]
MSITLITGSLGTGKTALAVKLLTEHSYYSDNAVVVGVREWQGGGAYYPLKSMQDATANQKLIGEIGGLPGTVYLVDEAKKIWPSRIAGKPTPEFIDSHLAESRSIAQDWILTAQAPTQIDVALRRLVGRHIHLEKTALGIKYSEAGQIREDLKFNRDESRKYSFPVESLKFYKSDDGVSDLQKKGLRLPKRLIFLMVLIFVLAGVIYYYGSKSTMIGFGSTEETPQTSEEKLTSASFIPSGSAHPQPAPKNDKPLKLNEAPDIYYFLPKDPAFPEIAKAPRVPLSCLSSKSQGCICYDQYMNRIKDFPVKRCEDIIKGDDQVAFTRNPHYLN